LSEPVLIDRFIIAQFILIRTIFLILFFKLNEEENARIALLRAERLRQEAEQRKETIAAELATVHLVRNSLFL